MAYVFNPFTGNLDTTDVVAFNGEVGTGTAASPSLFFTGDSNTGIFSPSADNLGITTSGSEHVRVTDAGYFCVTNSGSFQATSLHNFKSTQPTSTCAVYNTNSSTPSGLLVLYPSAAPNNSGSNFLYCADSSGQKASIRSNGGLANFQSNNVDLSDQRSKRNITSASSTWDCVQAWDVVNYNYIDDAADDSSRIGVIAQQVQQHCPEVVTPYQEAEDATLDEGGNVITPAKEERLGVREQQMMWMAIKALQEAQVRIETLESEVAALKAQ